MNAKLKAELNLAAKDFKPRARPWTSHENEALRLYYGKVPTSLLAKKLGRTIASVQNHVCDLGDLGC